MVFKLNSYGSREKIVNGKKVIDQKYKAVLDKKNGNENAHVLVRDKDQLFAFGVC